MRALPLLAVALLALVLAGLACTPPAQQNTDPVINGMFALDANPRSVRPGGTSVVTVNASDANAGDTLTYAWAVDDAAKGAVAAGATAGTGVFTAAADAAEGTVATITVTVDDGNGGTTEASVDITISETGGFAVPEGTTAGYVGADTCGQCHTRFHSRWSGSAHAEANYTGTRAEGFDATWTNVECEDCHGAGHDHATDPQRRNTDDSPWDQIDVPTYTVCGTCHVTGTGAPAAYTEWSTYDATPEDTTDPVGTGHFNAMEPMVGRSAEEAYCLDCHSGQRIELQQDVLPPPEVVPATLVEDPVIAEETEGVTCVVCHSPHGLNARDPNPDDDFGVASLCLECHSNRSTNTPFITAPAWDDTRNAPAQPRFNPAGEFIQGIAAYEDNVTLTELAPDPGPHAGATDPDAEGTGHLCVACHMYATANSTGHTFRIRLEAGENRCEGCHSWQDVAAIQADLEEVQTATEARLAAIRPYIPGRTSWGASFSRDQYDALSADDQVRFQIAVWNYGLINRDGSVGAHNPDFANAVLEVTEGILNNIAGAAL